MSEQTKLEVVGVLYKDLGTQIISDKLEKREFVIETIDEQYPQLVKFELTNDKCKILDGYKQGDKIKVSFNLRGREWKKDANTPPAYFTNLAAWRIVKTDGNDFESTAAHTEPINAKAKQETAPVPTGGDDLPF